MAAKLAILGPVTVAYPTQNTKEKQKLACFGMSEVPNSFLVVLFSFVFPLAS